MVTHGAETGICTVDTFPPDTVQRRGTAALTYHTIMLHSCRRRGREGGRGGEGGREEGRKVLIIASKTTCMCTCLYYMVEEAIQGMALVAAVIM